MIVPAFLFDEDIPRGLFRAVSRMEPGIDIQVVGRGSAPPTGTHDRDLLIFAEAQKRVLVSRDRNTLPQHAANHILSGRHTWGVLLLRESATVTEIGLFLQAIWGASSADEWIDRVEYIP